MVMEQPMGQEDMFPQEKPRKPKVVEAEVINIADLPSTSKSEKELRCPECERSFVGLTTCPSCRPYVTLKEDTAE